MYNSLGLIVIISCIIILIYCILFRKSIKKINLFIDGINKQKSLKNIKNYYDFFNSINYIYNHLTPLSLNIYLYEHNKIIKLKFLYQIVKSKINKHVSIFKSKLDNIPISILELTSKAYNSKDIILQNVKNFSDYDRDLYDNMVDCKINNIYLKNLYDDGDVPCGLIILTYKNKKLKENELKMLDKESLYLAKIIKSMNSC